MSSLLSASPLVLAVPFGGADSAGFASSSELSGSAPDMKPSSGDSSPRSRSAASSSELSFIGS